MNAPLAHRHAPAWRSFRVMVILGLNDKRIDTGEEFESRPLGDLWNLTPGDRPKHCGLAFLPSLYHEHAGRAQKVQRERGEFVALGGDFDKGNHPIAEIEAFEKDPTVGTLVLS